MPYAFVYFITPLGSGLRKKHDAYPDLDDYVDWIEDNYPDRILLAGEVVPTNYGPIKADSQFYNEVTRLFNEGKHIGERAQAIESFNDWAVKRGFAPYRDAASTPVATAAPLIKGKPRTVIVQDWIEDTGASEVARRAWDATVAACKGV